MDRETYQDAFDEAKQSMQKKRGLVIAELSGAEWQPPLLELSYLNRLIRVDHRSGEFGENDLNFEEKIICYQYLAEASGVEGPGEDRLSFLQMPQGEHHYEPFVKEAISPLAMRFGSQPDEFIRAGMSLGGQKITGGDAAFHLRVLPKISLDFMLWAGDEEFPARANILFDHKASFHLPTATLYMLGIAVSQRLVRA